MNGIAIVILTAILVEALVEYGQVILEQPKMIASVILGILLAFVFKAAMFTNLGVEVNLYADLVLSGILISRGSNHVYDFMQRITQATTKPLA